MELEDILGIDKIEPIKFDCDPGPSTLNEWLRSKGVNPIEINLDAILSPTIGAPVKFINDYYM